MQDFEILTNPDTQMLIDELRKEIEKEDYDLDYIRDLVFYGHFDVDALWEDEEGIKWTFVMKASYLNKPDIVKVLLEDGEADPNLQDKHGSTALIIASANGHSKVVEALLKHPKTDPNIKRPDGSTALMVASSRGESPAVGELLKHPNINKGLKDKRGQTAWDIADDEIREEFPELEP